MFIEIATSANKLNLNQRWATYLTAIVSILLLLIGLNTRQSILSAVVSYTNTQAGISVQYPQNWLLDTASNDYVFRIRDMRQTGFKTTIQVSIEPIGTNTEGNSVVDRLTRERAQTLVAYTPNPPEEFIFQNDINALSSQYTYVDQQASPFLQGIVSVVRGIDMIVIRRGQAIVVTYRADLDTYDQQWPRFLQFLNTLQI